MADDIDIPDMRRLSSEEELMKREFVAALETRDQLMLNRGRAEAAAEIERLRAIKCGTEGHDQPCRFCGKQTNSYAGNPNQWPIPLCIDPTSPGVVQWYHHGCVAERLHEIERLRASEWEYKERAENAESFIGHRGYRRCDIPACNCGSWHGGDMEQRFDELHDAIGENGKTLLKAAQDLKASEEQAVADADVMYRKLHEPGPRTVGAFREFMRDLNAALSRAAARKAKEASDGG